MRGEEIGDDDGETVVTLLSVGWTVVIFTTEGCGVVNGEEIGDTVGEGEVPLVGGRVS